MPAKYVIHTNTAPHRFEPITRSGIIAWEEGCLKCPVCVKKECIYRVYDNRILRTHQMIDSTDNQCMNCLRCIQGCPKELIHKSINPEYKAMGDSHWTPEIITSLWNQAETGKIPVSGAGYPGPFSGRGFDSMWTDMSEIVRPTRDGIHGREYISTAIDLGKAPAHLDFSPEGDLESDMPPIVDIPLPILLKVPPFGAISNDTIRGWGMAARHLGTLMALPQEMINPALDGFDQFLIPMLLPDTSDSNRTPRGVRIMEVPWSEDWQGAVKDLRGSYPHRLISLRIPLVEGIEENIPSAVEEGVSIIHLQGALNGRFLDDDEKHLKDGIRSVHRRLVEAKTRDEVTLLASGGLAMAEHIAKAMICGADAVFVDFPILIALECRMCRRCTKGLPCPVEIGSAPPSWVASRSINLLGAWHNQLLEVMGAMGMRDARRLRGEAGRAMFFEELDRNTFGTMGVIKEGCELE